jgi:hypothetical protein
LNASLRKPFSAQVGLSNVELICTIAEAKTGAPHRTSVELNQILLVLL